MVPTREPDSQTESDPDSPSFQLVDSHMDGIIGPLNRELSTGYSRSIPWGIQAWLEEAGLWALYMEIDFELVKGVSKAEWVEGFDANLEVRVAAAAPEVDNRTEWNLAIIAHCEAALAEIALQLGFTPPPRIPRTEEERDREAEGPAIKVRPINLVFLPRVTATLPASRDEVWEEIDFFFREGYEALVERWEALSPEVVRGLQAAGRDELAKWIKANEPFEDSPFWAHPEFQAAALMSLGRETYYRAVENAADFVEVCPEGDSEEILTAFEFD